MSIPEKDDPTKIGIGDESAWPLLSDLDLDVVVLPPQEDEFTCVSCFLVKHQSQFDHKTDLGPICIECAA